MCKYKLVYYTSTRNIKSPGTLCLVKSEARNGHWSSMNWAVNTQEGNLINISNVCVFNKCSYMKLQYSHTIHRLLENIWNLFVLASPGPGFPTSYDVVVFVLSELRCHSLNLIFINQHHDIAEILLMLALNTNQSINQSTNQSIDQSIIITNIRAINQHYFYFGL